MKQVAFVSILVVLLATTAFAQQPSPTTASVIAVQGVPLLQRAGWSSSATLSIGMLVLDTDTILLAPGQSVTLQCGDGSTKTLHTIPGSPQCAPTNPWDYSFGGAVITGGQRALPNRYAQIPYLITPRNTRILDSETLVFDWADLDGAARYVLRVLDGEGKRVIEADSRRSELEYSPDAPLPPGPYVVTITAFDRQNNPITVPPDPGISEQLGGIYFIVVDAETATAIKEGAAAIQAAELPEDAISGIIDYQLALHYAGKQVYSTAITLLTGLLPVDVAGGEPLPDTLPPDVMASQPSLYLLLGNIYHLIGLPVEARRVYQAGLEVAERIQDTTSAAALHTGLARVTPERALTVGYYEAAIDFFDTVGDAEQVNTLREELAAYQ